MRVVPQVPTIDRMKALLALLLALSAILAACEDDAPAVPDSPTATPSASAGAPVPTATARATVTATTAATAAPTATSEERVASTASIPTAELPVVRFTSASGAAAELPVEVPPESEYGIGLSGRATLEDRGMIFYYPGETGGPGFWMKNTHIDLDIAFVAADGTIIEIAEMQAESEEIHHPGRNYLAGIEAPAGWFAAAGIRAGDRYEFLFDPGKVRPES